MIQIDELTVVLAIAYISITIPIVIAYFTQKDKSKQ